MSDVECPCCKKGVQARHTYMASLPATIVCTGCGSWFQIDVVNSGGKALAGLVVATLISAYFWPIMLVLLPLYLVMSFGSLQRFEVELLKEPQAELWTISRETGEIRRLENEEVNEKLGQNIPDAKLSEKFARLRPLERNVFREKAQKYRSLRARARMSHTSSIGAQALNPGGGPPQLSH